MNASSKVGASRTRRRSKGVTPTNDAVKAGKAIKTVSGPRASATSKVGEQDKETRRRRKGAAPTKGAEKVVKASATGNNRRVSVSRKVAASRTAAPTRNLRNRTGADRSSAGSNLLRRPRRRARTAAPGRGARAASGPGHARSERRSGPSGAARAWPAGRHRRSGRSWWRRRRSADASRAARPRPRWRRGPRRPGPARSIKSIAKIGRPVRPPDLDRGRRQITYCRSGG